MTEKHVQCDCGSTQIKIVVGEILVLIITIAGMFLWSRSEAREDFRLMQNLIDSMHQNMDSMHHEMMQEMKDFHGRLCALEEKDRGK